MILGIEQEVFIFLQAMLTGNLICLVYNVIRVLRRIVRHNLFWVSLEDLVFWIGTGFYLFFKICQTSNGSIRWYFVVGVLTGGVFTYLLIQKIVKKHLAKTKKKE